ncbi:MAG: hypothetical protein M3015_15655 [Bacteroidota bacterium]|nr:hypothetical protein [Bacteroidota bacterium]
MIIVHAVQKLLNISRLKPALFISKPADGQEMHSWYAKLIATGFAGKFLVMYVHNPSLLLVLTRGKTIKGTMPEFSSRLAALLKRHYFKDAFIKKEIKLINDGFVISKTDSKSMLGNMNAITENIEISCLRFKGYEVIDISQIEDIYTRWLTRDTSRPGGYRYTIDFWNDKGVLNL